MNEKFKELIGYELDIIELSNKLQELGCEDICDFGNWEEILDSGDVVVATDEQGENHIQIFFEIVFRNSGNEKVESTVIEITNIEDFNV